MVLQWIGAIVTFVNYPEGKKFIKNTMDIYSNGEILSPCLEIEDDNKRLINTSRQGFNYLEIQGPLLSSEEIQSRKKWLGRSAHERALADKYRTDGNAF